MERKSFLFKSALNYGLILGAYYFAKYILMVVGFQVPMLNLVYLFLTLLVPFLVYYLVKHYKDHYAGGVLPFFDAWRFSFLMMIGAALLIAVVHYLFYKYVAPPDFLEQTIAQTIELLKASGQESTLTKSVEEMPIPTAADMMLSGLNLNVFFSILVSLPVAFFVSKQDNSKVTPLEKKEE